MSASVMDMLKFERVSRKDWPRDQVSYASSAEHFALDVGGPAVPGSKLALLNWGNDFTGSALSNVEPKCLSIVSMRTDPVLLDIL
jgi:hypothetical protein